LPCPLAQGVEEVLKLSVGGCNVDPVALLKDCVTVGNEDLFASAHGTDKDTDLVFSVYICQGQVLQPAVSAHAEFDKLHSSLYKRLHFTCVRKEQHPGDLVGHSQLRIDCHAQMQVLFQESYLTVIN